MTFYECYLLDATGKPGSCEQVEDASQTSAIVTCRTILAAQPHYAAFELWQFKRWICTEVRRQPVVRLALPVSGQTRPRLRATKMSWSLQSPPSQLADSA